MDHPPISRKSLSEFKAIWRDKHGEALTDEEALEMAERLLRAVSILLRTPGGLPKPSRVRTASDLTDETSSPYDDGPDL